MARIVPLQLFQQRARSKSLLLSCTLIPILFLAGLLWIAQASADRLNPTSPPLSPDQTIRIEFLYNGNDPVAAAGAADTFAALVSLATGLDTEASLFPCEEGLVQRLGLGHVDVAPIRGVAYVLGRDSYGFEPELAHIRFGQHNYRGQFNIQATSGYTDIWGLQGARYAAPYPTSISGYFLPYLMISDTTGLTPDQFFGEVNFVGSHDQVIRDVYTGTVDVGTAYEDARQGVAGQYPDVYSVVSVLTHTEYMPNDPWVFRAGLSASTVHTLTQGISDIARISAGQDALETLLGFRPDGAATVTDPEYDVVQAMVNTFGGETQACQRNYLPSVLGTD